MTHPADDFRSSRFATHPDGRIAARIDTLTVWPWYCSEPGDIPRCVTDERMASDGWSPLDETRFPRVVTDEMVERAVYVYDTEPNPTTYEDAMRAAYRHYGDPARMHHPDGFNAEFDRFLAKVRMDAAREALDGAEEYALRRHEAAGYALRADGWRFAREAVRDYRDAHYPQGGTDGR